MKLIKAGIPKWEQYVSGAKKPAKNLVGISKDTKADFNSITLKLENRMHPNRQLQLLWNTYGKDGFELEVLNVLKYEDPKEDHTSKLEALRQMYLDANPEAKLIWR